MSAAAELVQKEIKKNALEPQDQAEYQKRYDALTKRFNTAKRISLTLRRKSAETDSPDLPSGSFWLRLANRKTL